MKAHKLFWREPPGCGGNEPWQLRRADNFYQRHAANENRPGRNLPPVAVFMEKFNSDDKVIEMANNSTFGLCSYIWTKDMARGMRFANEIAAGTVWLSNALTLAPELPWTG